NIVISGVPEESLFIDNKEVTNDDEKISCILNEVSPGLSYTSSNRLGRFLKGQQRPLCVSLRSVEDKLKVLRLKKNLGKSDHLIKSFKQKVFVNPDKSYLARQEDKRLRDELMRRRRLDPDASIYIKSGKLFVDSKVVDEFHLSNQLF
ncbi:MAG: hypothetical protein AAGK05_18290, partial [Pseudomonadota bacterium]